ncbi:MAG: AMP-binding protein [Bacteroidetes bacterium]|nr:AMP-binding protein [Bacteroidota bacterium]
MNTAKEKSREEIMVFQDVELQKLLHYLNNNSPYYKNQFAINKIAVDKIKTVADLTLLPVTTKDDLHAHNWDFLCIPKKEIVEFCSTSGTLGNPVTIGLSEKDLQRLAFNEYNSFVTAGITSLDTIHLMLSLDRQFMAGIAYFLGARMLGAGIIRGGPGNFAMQLETISRLQPTVLVAVPSFIMSLVTYAKDKNIDLNSTSVRKIICIGENIRDEHLKLNALGERIANNWNVTLFSTYASTEQQTAFTECQCGNGGHHQPELLILEILDEANMPLPAGEFGELTITTLGVEGMPLLRYKTGDVCAYINEPCKCGRTTMRITPIIGRKKQLIKFKGTTLYPQSLFNILNTIESIEDYVIEVTQNDLGLDNLTIHIAFKLENERDFSQIGQLLQSALRVLPAIKILSLADIHKMQLGDGKRKVNRFIDFR